VTRFEYSLQRGKVGQINPTLQCDEEPGATEGESLQRDRARRQTIASMQYGAMTFEPGRRRNTADADCGPGREARLANRPTFGMSRARAAASPPIGPPRPGACLVSVAGELQGARARPEFEHKAGGCWRDSEKPFFSRQSTSLIPTGARFFPVIKGGVVHQPCQPSRCSSEP